MAVHQQILTKFELTEVLDGESFNSININGTNYDVKMQWCVSERYHCLFLLVDEQSCADSAGDRFALDIMPTLVSN